MTEPEITDPGAEEQLRTRLRAYAAAVADRTDAEVVLAELPTEPRRSTSRGLAIAACLLTLVAVGAALRRELVAGTDPAAPLEDCVETTNETLPEPTTPGGPMNTRLAAPLAVAGASIALLGSCDTGPRTLADGDVELVGDDGLGGQHVVVDVVEEDGVVSGELRLNDSGVDDPLQLTVITVECARTDVDDLVIIGGTVTGTDGNGNLGNLFALGIREGDPARLALYFNDDDEAATCEELVDGLTDEQLADPPADNAAEVESGDLDLG
jgi:hypothetical protein